jgi:hypothetical protein
MNKNIIIIVILILLVILIVFGYKKKTNKINQINQINSSNYNYFWVYWDDLNGRDNRPAYIDICLETIKKHTMKDFNLVMLSKDNIDNYLPELINLRKQVDLDKLVLAQKVDLYRIMLLYKYGGFYVDADTILLKNPIDLFNILINSQEYDYIGYGCTGDICFPDDISSYSKPSNGVMISKPGTLLMKNIYNNIIKRLQNKDKDFKSPDNYYEIGKLPIWEELNLLIKNNNYKYYHIKSEIGVRDTSGQWVTASRLFSQEEFKFKDEDKLIMVVLYNNMMDELKKIKREELLNSNMNITKYFKKALY